MAMVGFGFVKIALTTIDFLNYLKPKTRYTISGDILSKLLIVAASLMLKPTTCWRMNGLTNVYPTISKTHNGIDVSVDDH
jgi:hypothetical protein